MAELDAKEASITNVKPAPPLTLRKLETLNVTGNQSCHHFHFNLNMKQIEKMNLLDHSVVEATSKPHKLYEKWWVKVKANCYGKIYDTSVMFQLYEDACQVGIGYKFLA